MKLLMVKKILIIAIYIGFFKNDLLGVSPQNEGLFEHFKMENSLVIISLYLPYNPTILVLGPDESHIQCKKNWPLAHIITSTEEYLLQENDIDFLWVHCASDHPDISALNSLRNLKALYLTNTHENNSLALRYKTDHILKNNHLVFCTKWQNENSEIGIFFLKEELQNGFVNSINFNLPNRHSSVGSFLPPSFEGPFKCVENKEMCKSIPHIDFIYMINLDDRPEKFQASILQLQKYDISPCRFSAINGWELPASDLQRFGVRLANTNVTKKVMGKVYRKIEETEYINIEFIEDPNLTYFCTGITRGAIGCLLSHLTVLQDAYDSNYECIWVMEDDIQIIEDPLQLSDLILELTQIDPNWDIFFTDIDHKDSFGNYIPCRALAMRPNFPIEPLSYYMNKFCDINEHFSITGMRYGTHSMIIHRSGIKKILDYYKEFALFLPYDCDYWLIPSIKMYYPKKDIISVVLNPISDNNALNYKENQKSHN